MRPVTAVLAWLILGDTLSARELVGVVVAVIGVAVATTLARPAPVGAPAGTEEQADEGRPDPAREG